MNGEIKISGKWAFYFYDTYGIPVEIFELVVNEWLRRNA